MAILAELQADRPADAPPLDLTLSFTNITGVRCCIAVMVSNRCSFGITGTPVLTWENLAGGGPVTIPTVRIFSDSNAFHAACYALLAYRTAYLKSSYPAEYMAALLSSVMDTKDRVPFYVAASQDMGLEVLPPDVNASRADFAVTGILDWQTARVDHPFTDFELGESQKTIWRRHRASFPTLRRRY